MTAANPHTLTLLTRDGCHSCEVARGVLDELAADLALEYDIVDVDALAPTDPSLRARYGDRLPVVLLDGQEHSYWEVDVPRLRADLTAP